MSNPDARTQTDGFNVGKEGRLYIAGGGSGQLHVYDLPSGRKIAQLGPITVSFINEVDIDPNNGDVYFTDSVNPFIYRVTEEQVKTGTGTPELIPLAPESTTLRAIGPTLNWKLTASGSRPAVSSSSSTA